MRKKKKPRAWTFSEQGHPWACDRQADNRVSNTSKPLCPIKEHVTHSWFFNFFKTFYFRLECSRLIHNVVIVSGEQWRDTATHIHVSILPQTPLPSWQEGSDLTLHNNHALLCFAQTSRDCPSRFLFSLARGGDGRGHVGGRGCYFIFLDISHVYRRYTCYYTSVYFSLVNLLLRGGSQLQNLEREGRRLGFLPYSITSIKSRMQILICCMITAVFFKGLCKKNCITEKINH